MNEFETVICPGCGHDIDPEVCHCGDYIKDHSFACGHNPVPMGCICGYADKTENKEGVN